RLLRFEVERTDLRRGFIVYDQDDARALVKACERELSIDEKTWLPARLQNGISRAKAACQEPHQIRALLEDARNDMFTTVLSQVYPLYQRKLVEANACDFDDLLMRSVLLLQSDDAVRDKWQERTRHLLVDEYQDTNHIQYRL